MTEHGCFQHYLNRFARADAPSCVSCGSTKDDAEYTLFDCGRWARKKLELEFRLDAALSPDTIVDCMLSSREKWDMISNYVETILKTKEDEERLRQAPA